MPFDTHASNACKMSGFTQYELPNKSLYTFSGRIVLDGQEPCGVGPSNVLLRGCLVRR